MFRLLINKMLFGKNILFVLEDEKTRRFRKVWKTGIQEYGNTRH